MFSCLLPVNHYSGLLTGPQKRDANSNGFPEILQFNRGVDLKANRPLGRFQPTQLMSLFGKGLLPNIPASIYM